MRMYMAEIDEAKFKVALNPDERISERDKARARVREMRRSMDELQRRELLAHEIFLSQVNSRQTPLVKAEKLAFLTGLHCAQSPLCHSFARDRLFEPRILPIILEFLNERHNYDVGQL